MVRRKTAKLFEAAARLGAILGGALARDRGRLRRLRPHLGTAFQLIDDVLDYSGDLHETGKNLGDDLDEGKPTLPLIHVMRRGTPAQARLVRQAIEEGGRDEFAAVLDAIHASGALDYARGAGAGRGGSGLRRARAPPAIQTTGNVCYNWRPSRWSAITDSAGAAAVFPRLGV